MEVNRYEHGKIGREKDDVMAVVTNVKELAGDVLAGAKAFNEKRAAEQAEVIEDTAEKAE